MNEGKSILLILSRAKCRAKLASEWLELGYAKHSSIFIVMYILRFSFTSFAMNKALVISIIYALL